MDKFLNNMQSTKDVKIVPCTAGTSSNLSLIEVSWKGTCLIACRQFSQCASFLKAEDDLRTKKYKSRYSLRQLHFYGFLLLTILLPASMSIPLRGKRSSDKLTRTDEKPHWVNPCPGVPTSSHEGEKQQQTADDENTGSDADYINSIILTAKHAIYQAEKFREEYVLKTFHVELSKHHNQWKAVKYMWLRQDATIPKDLGEKVSGDHLEALELEDEAVKIYGYLQRLAVAFEQIIMDHRDQNFEFKEEFAISENNLKSILCELREIIPVSKLSLFEDASREIMAPEYRHMENLTHQHVRDWLIFRDYMNLVEYIIQVMEHFKSKTV